MLITVQVRLSTVPFITREQNHTTVTPTDLRRRRKSAADASSQPDARRAAELLRVADELGITLEPMHEGAEEPELQTYFTVEVPDAQTAERIAERLRACAAIEAAYLKPTDELP